jgi:hypothetical protein
MAEKYRPRDSSHCMEIPWYTSDHHAAASDTVVPAVNTWERAVDGASCLLFFVTCRDKSFLASFGRATKEATSPQPPTTQLHQSKAQLLSITVLCLACFARGVSTDDVGSLNPSTGTFLVPWLPPRVYMDPAVQKRIKEIQNEAYLRLLRVVCAQPYDWVRIETILTLLFRIGGCQLHDSSTTA